MSLSESWGEPRDSAARRRDAISASGRRANAGDGAVPPQPEGQRGVYGRPPFLGQAHFHRNVLWILAAVLLPSLLSGQGICEPDPVSLAELWDQGSAIEPGYRAQRSAVEAAELELSASRLAWLPGFRIDAHGDQGQRTSPGEERALGVGARGELRLTTQWNLLDGSRRWDRRTAELQASAARVGVREHDQRYRSELAHLYLEAALAEIEAQTHQNGEERLRELHEVVRLRIEAGVDHAWEEASLEASLARTERARIEASRRRAGTAAELALAVGVCVSPLRIEAEDLELDLVPRLEADDSPEVERRRVEAGIREAMAGAEANRDRFLLGLVGTAGPTRSRAFDPGPVEYEYLVGVSASWALDPAGLRGRHSEAQIARAAGLRADAESLGMALDREISRIESELALAGAEREALGTERTLAEARFQAAQERWREGVGLWTEVMDAATLLLEAELLEVAWTRRVGGDLVRLLESAGAMDELPNLWGQR